MRIKPTPYLLALAIPLLLLLPISQGAYANELKPRYEKSQNATVKNLESLTFTSGTMLVNGKPYILGGKEGLVLRFDNGFLTFTANCNTFSGKFSLKNGVLNAKSLSSTKIGCGESQRKEDLWFEKVFTGKPKLSIQYLSSNSKIKSDPILLTIHSNVLPNLKSGKVIFKLAVKDYGYVDAPLGDVKSANLAKAICSELLEQRASESVAKFKAEQSGLILRVVSRDGEDFAVTTDFLVNRINVGIIKSEVKSCFQG